MRQAQHWQAILVTLPDYGRDKLYERRYLALTRNPNSNLTPTLTYSICSTAFYYFTPSLPRTNIRMYQIGTCLRLDAGSTRPLTLTITLTLTF